MHTGRELVSLSNSFRKCRMKEGLILHECMFLLIFAVKLKHRNSPSEKHQKPRADQLTPQCAEVLTF